MEVEADSIPVLVVKDKACVEERRAPRGERFEGVVSTELVEYPGEYWMIGEWAVARFLPHDGVKIVSGRRNPRRICQ